MRWLRRIVNVFVSGRVERDIRREVSFHIAERTDDLRASGLSEAEAARQARARFGNPTLQAERTRDVDVARWLDTFLRDLRYAARSLARSPAFTLTVVLTLALAIGANTAVFSALDAVLFRPLPFPDADRLVQVSQTQQRSSGTFIAPARLQDWVRLNTAFDALAGYYVEDASETSGDLPERVRRAFVTPQFFDVWGILPAQGRAFEPGEYRFGGTAAVVVSDRFWRQRLGADPNVLGRQIRLGTASIPIVGVMPATFRFPDRTVDLWMAVSVDAPYAQSRQMTWYTGIGRLRPGVTPAQARENLMAVQTQLAEQHPDTDRGLGAGVVPLDQSTVGDAGSSLWLLFGAVTVLLLIACTNIAALLLSRATARRHEIAVRFSLGASRRAVAAQLLTEAAVLAAAGAAAGLLLAYGAAGALRVAAGDLPRIEDMAIDSRVLLYTLVATIGVALLCGLIPAIRTAGLVSRRDDGRVQVSSRSPLQWLLVGTQVALAVMLLAAAGLLLRSVHELSLVNRGFDADRVLAFRMSGSWGETADFPVCASASTGRSTRCAPSQVSRRRPRLAGRCPASPSSGKPRSRSSRHATTPHSRRSSPKDAPSRPSTSRRCGFRCWQARRVGARARSTAPICWSTRRSRAGTSPAGRPRWACTSGTSPAPAEPPAASSASSGTPANAGSIAIRGRSSTGASARRTPPPTSSCGPAGSRRPSRRRSASG
jgi:hypothetical protein